MFLFKHLNLALAIVIVTFLPRSLTAQNLIINGNFSIANGTANANPAISGNSIVIPGWTIIGDVDLGDGSELGTPFSTFTPGQFVDLLGNAPLEVGDPPGGTDLSTVAGYVPNGLSQTVTTTVGALYEISFDFSVNIIVTPRTSADVFLNGTLIGTATYSLAGVGQTDTFTASFTGSGSDELRIIQRITGGNNQGTLVDNISIVEISGLPVELIDFQAKNSNNRSVDLEWQTASEKNNAFFEIYRSLDMENWEFISHIDGVAGNSSDLLSYSFEDLTPYTGLSYYRLSQVDMDGTSTYSNIRSVTIKPTCDSGLLIFPNPTSQKVKITGGDNELRSLRLFDSMGQEIPLIVLANGDGSITLNISHLASGIYSLKSDESVYKFIKD